MKPAVSGDHEQGIGQYLPGSNRRVETAMVDGQAAMPAKPGNPLAGLMAVAGFLVENIAQRVVQLLLQALHCSPRDRAAESSGLLNVQQAARHLGVNTNAVYKLSAAGKLGSVKIGGRLRFRRVDLDEFVSSRTRSAAEVLRLARAARTASPE